MQVLALEPWYGGSHRDFLDGLAAHSAHALHTVTLPGRFWRWRMEGGPVNLAAKTRVLLAEGLRPDVLFASDMVNLPAFLALMRPHLAGVPVVLYFHENQLTYPLPEGRSRARGYAHINYLSALVADRVAFNSHFHRDEFLDALPVFLRAYPDFTNLHTVADLRAKSTVVPLGLDLAAHDAHRPDGLNADAPSLAAGAAADGGPPVVLWNQRWEYDKNPEAFFEVMNRLDDVGCRFRLILAGECFPEEPPEAFDRAFARYADRILHYGYAEDFAAYSRLLHRADLVVSTAIHEFFGVALLEAVYCGCHPLVPNRLSYPELIPDRLHRPLLHAPVLYDTRRDLFDTLRAILDGEARPLPRTTLRAIPAPLDWPRHAPAFDALLEQGAAR